MDIFYIIVLCVMVIVLILYLTLMGIKLSFSKGSPSNIKIQSCPDSWSSIMYNNQQWCVVPKGIYKRNFNRCPDFMPNGIMENGIDSDCSNCNFNDLYSYSTAINFKSDKWVEKAGTDGILLKDKWKRWANSKGISWDTVTNS